MLVHARFVNRIITLITGHFKTVTVSPAANTFIHLGNVWLGRVTDALAGEICSKYDWTTAKGKQEEIQELNDHSKTDSKLDVVTYMGVVE